MADWLIERGIGEERALLVEHDRVLAAKVRWPDELNAGNVVTATLVTRAAGSPRGVARTDDGDDILVDRLPRSASEGGAVGIVVTRAAIGERGRLKRPQGRWFDVALPPEPAADDVFSRAREVRRLPAGLWDEVWHTALESAIAFDGGNALFALTPGMTVIDVDGDVAPRTLALRSIPAIAQGIRQFDLGGSIGIDFPTLSAKADRQAVDAALGAALAGWPHERTAMNGFGFVQLVARVTGPSLLHRLAYRRPAAAARMLLRRAELLDNPGAILLTAHSAVLSAMRPEWFGELARRTGREIRIEADHSLALAAAHAQIVPR